MPHPSTDLDADVVVVGGGAAGTLTLVHLLHGAAPGLRVVVVEPASELGRGVAYAQSHLFRLNVPAGDISALPEDRGHFLRWLRAECPGAQPTTFALRADFGRYLADTLTAASAAAEDVRLDHVRDRATSLAPRDGVIHVNLDSGRRIVAAAVVVAAGLQPPRTDWAPGQLLASPAFVPDPWSPSALEALHREPGSSGTDDVLLVGSGLTAVDLALLLARPGRVVHLVSRSGRLPQAHSAQALAGAPERSVAAQAEVRERVRAAPATAAGIAAALQAPGRDIGNWRWLFDAVRPITQETWQRLPLGERAGLARQWGGWWERHRHRMPPEVASRIGALRSAGRVTVSRGEVQGVRDAGGALDVTLSSGRELRVRHVVNCTGPRLDPDPTSLLGRLFTSGLALPDPLGFGVATLDGRLRAADGSAAAPVWTLGSARRGELWETTAIPEIRVQAQQVTRAVLAQLATDHGER